MALKLGSSTVGSLYLGSDKVSEMYLGSHKVYSSGMPALAPKSIRFDFKYDHWNPVEVLPEVSGMSWTHVSGDVYDFHCDRTNWTYDGQNSVSIFNYYFYMSSGKKAYFMTQHQFDVLDMDLTGVTSVAYLFGGAYQIQNIFSIRSTSSLENTNSMFYHNRNNIQIPFVPLFDTSSCTNMSHMFQGCIALTSIPLFDTSSCTYMENFAAGCVKVETGALALYQQASTQSTPPTSHSGTFGQCGRDTDPSAPIHAEMAQIPTSWGGTMA